MSNMSISFKADEIMLQKKLEAITAFYAKEGIREKSNASKVIRDLLKIWVATELKNIKNTYHVSPTRLMEMFRDYKARKESFTEVLINTFDKPEQTKLINKHFGKKSDNRP